MNAQPESRPKLDIRSPEDQQATLTTLGKLGEREGPAALEASSRHYERTVGPSFRNRMNLDRNAEAGAAEFHGKPMERWYSMANSLDQAGAEMIKQKLDEGDLAGAGHAARFRNIAQQKLGHEAIMAPSIAGTIPSQRTW